MDEYVIIDDKLINSSYGLLYLLNVLTFRRVDIGRNINELNNLYATLVSAVKDNLAIYKQIESDKLSTAVNTSASNKLSMEIRDTTNKIYQRLKILDEQKAILKNNVIEINNNSANLEKIVTPNVNDIINKLKNQISIYS